MPQTKSAKKALRQEKRRHLFNVRTSRELKEALKQTRKKPDRKSMSTAISLLDQAAKKGVIHKNKASRLKSRLSRNVVPETSKKTSKKK